MSKRIFVQKNGRGGDRSPARLLLWPALALVVLVLLVTLFMRDDRDRETVRKPAPEKGAVVREMPKPQPPEEMAVPPAERAEIPRADGPGMAAAPEPRPSTPPAPEDVSPVPGGLNERMATPGQVPPPLQGAGEPKPNEMTSPPKGWAQPGYPPPLEEPQTAQTEKLEAPPQPQTSTAKPRVAVTLPPGAGKLTKVSPAEGKPAGERVKPIEETKKPTPPATKTGYAVRVGSFKERQNAEEVRNTLQKKGYEVTLTTTQNAKLGQLYVVQLKPVQSMGKASTLVEQIKNEQKVSPMIVPAGAGEQAAQ